MYQRIYKNILTLLMALLFIVSMNCHAFAQDEKLWLALNAQQKWGPDERLLSLIYSRFQFIDKSHPWQATLIEGGVGYEFVPEQSIWMGYRWTANNPNNGFYQENRLFQQWLWQNKLSELHRILLRSRLEEIERGDQTGIDVRLRERIALQILKPLFKHVFPFFYEEIFLQMNNTGYTSNKFVSQNRIFIGFNMYESKKTWWEIGYINQFLFSTPLNSQNTMSHIMSVTYNFY